MLVTLLCATAFAAPEGRPELSVRPVASLQLWGTVWDQDEDLQGDATGFGDPESDAGVSVKRVRLGLVGAIGDVNWEVLVGRTAPFDGFASDSGAIEVIDARIGWARDGFSVEAGRGRVPFSRDQMMGSGELTFTERGFGAEHVAPPRSLGLSATAARFGGKITLGVFNSGGTVWGDDNLGKTLVGRAEWATGNDTYRLWDGGKQTFAFGVGGGAFWTDDQSTRTIGAGGDALLRVAGLSMIADVAWRRVEPGDTTVEAPGVLAPMTRLALTGEVGWAFGPVRPAARWSHMIDEATGAWGLGLFGVTWHIFPDDKRRDRLRLGLGYVLRVEPDARPNDGVRLWAQVRT